MADESAHGRLATDVTGSWAVRTKTVWGHWVGHAPDDTTVESLHHTSGTTANDRIAEWTRHSLVFLRHPRPPACPIAVPPQVCICAPGFAGANCSVECPGRAGRRCTGHGTCSDGHTGDGRCRCALDWYGAACDVHCRPRLCHAPDVFPPPHAACEAGTGRCVCQRDAFGTWAGADCNECAPGYWGPQCTDLCHCSGHGTCGRVDGDCLCFADDVHGHWVGRRCGACAPGYMRPACRRRNVAISRAPEIPLPGLGVPLDGALVLDPQHRLLYVGGTQLLVIDVETRSTVMPLPYSPVHFCCCAVTPRRDVLTPRSGSRGFGLSAARREAPTAGG